MAARVQELLDGRKQLLIDISHELRTPLQRLGTIFVSIGEAEKGHVAPEVLKRAENDIKGIEELFEELLTLAQVESSLEYEREEVFLKDHLLSLVESDNYEWSKEGKSAEFTGEDLSVFGNAKLLGRAMRNVIHNAMRYSPAGGKTVISLVSDGADAVLCIRDYGCGVEEEELEKIFLPFYRTKSALALVRGGSGLGLPMARRILESHGGSCVASNAPDGGFMMTLRLPLMLETDAQE